MTALIDPSWPNPDHPQVEIAGHPYSAIVDEGIADDLLLLWSHGIETWFSCQGEPDLPWTRYVALADPSRVTEAAELLGWVKETTGSAVYGCEPSCCSQVRGAHCHCAGCHQTFANMTLFDGHQDVNYSRSPAVLCREPESLGLVRGTRGAWYTPAGLTASTERVAKMNSARSKGVGKA